MSRGGERPAQAGGSSAIMASRRRARRAAASRALTWSPGIAGLRPARAPRASGSAWPRHARPRGSRRPAPPRRRRVDRGAPRPRPRCASAWIAKTRYSPAVARRRAEASSASRGRPARIARSLQARERMHGLLRALARHLYRLFEVASRAIEIARLEQIIAHYCRAHPRSRARRQAVAPGRAPPRAGPRASAQAPHSAWTRPSTSRAYTVHSRWPSFPRDRERRRALAKRPRRTRPLPSRSRPRGSARRPRRLAPRARARWRAPARATGAHCSSCRPRPARRRALPAR